MTFDIDKAIAVLQRTPATLRALLDGLSDEWTMTNYGESTFSPFDVVGHLIHADRTNWMTRLKLILENGDAVPFPTFDRYAMLEASQGKSMSELLVTFAELRSANLTELRSMQLTDDMLSKTGRHPQLGSVTARQLLSSWVVHDLGHTHQIVKSMAYQYRDAVGKWREYLTILGR